MSTRLTTKGHWYASVFNHNEGTKNLLKWAIDNIKSPDNSPSSFLTIVIARNENSANVVDVYIATGSNTDLPIFQLDASVRDTEWFKSVLQYVHDIGSSVRGTLFDLIPADSNYKLILKVDFYRSRSNTDYGGKFHKDKAKENTFMVGLSYLNEEDMKGPEIIMDLNPLPHPISNIRAYQENGIYTALRPKIPKHGTITFSDNLLYHATPGDTSKDSLMATEYKPGANVYSKRIMMERSASGDLYPEIPMNILASNTLDNKTEPTRPDFLRTWFIKGTTQQANEMSTQGILEYIGSIGFNGIIENDTFFVPFTFAPFTDPAPTIPLTDCVMTKDINTNKLVVIEQPKRSFALDLDTTDKVDGLQQMGGTGKKTKKALRIRGGRRSPNPRRSPALRMRGGRRSPNPRRSPAWRYTKIV